MLSKELQKILFSEMPVMKNFAFDLKKVAKRYTKECQMPDGF